VDSVEIDERALATYLQRHLAGAGAARSIASQLIDETKDGPTLLFLDRFLRDIEEETHILRELVGRFDGGRSILEVVSSTASDVWGTVARALPKPQVLEVELLEALAAGVWGKRLMWSVLARVPDELELSLEATLLADLAERADDHERSIVGLHDAAIARTLWHDAGLPIG
jgi:hypothetical protein